MKQKGTFARRGKAILDPTRPQGLADFLGQEGEPVSTETQRSVDTETRRRPPRDDHKTEETAKPLQATAAKKRVVSPKPVREELRLTEEMGERLRRYAFEHRMKKIDVVTKALERFFRQEKS